MAPFRSLLAIFCAAIGAVEYASATQFSEYILAPNNRSVTPPTLYAVRGDVKNPKALCTNVHSSEGVVFAANTSITLDFGKNIAGTVQFDVRALSNDDGADEYLGFTFTESSEFISPYYGDSASHSNFDSPLWFRIPAKGNYAADMTHQRGGFRYMSIWHNSTGSITLGDLSVNFTASPEMESPHKYDGWFNSDSEKLNRVWYAGAYTNQLCSIDPNYGYSLAAQGANWNVVGKIANGTSALVDGAKRDRMVWPGDVVISAPSIFVSTNSLDGIKNAIDTLFLLQQTNGQLPYSGPLSTTSEKFRWSFTYHLHTLLNLYYYVTYTGDTEYLQSYWDRYKLALAYSIGTIDSSGLANVTSSRDWIRLGMGGHNIEANAILYHTIDMSLRLASVVGDKSVISNYTAAMKSIKAAANTVLWDPSSSLFLDNDTNPNGMHPQDGNSWAVIAGLADLDRAASISTALKARWVKPYGAPAPESPDVISPFVSGFEVQAHYLAGFPERAHELIEFMWADFMLDDPRMTNSSLIEGYTTDGELGYPQGGQPSRTSHAHGWSTGPTSALTFLAAGLELTGVGGRTWRIRPRLGGLERVTAGFMAPLGQFSSSWKAKGDVVVGQFQTPEGTSGTLVLPGNGSDVVITGLNGTVSPSSTVNGTVTYTGLAGGRYTIRSG
ncbi:Six-hairpin glycosidase [Aspergillus sergii]|uniref:Six-hairpin glycosidase n=1 Tax=Aspergillus sergii TaxID=1034303 RepID=A0A5N6X2A4_9EURO|nr:Six-hairpin glycosidase [Aspergillus sergii]